MAQTTGTDQETFQRRFLLLMVTAVSIVFLVMVKQFLVAVLLAAIFSGMTHPLYRRVLGWVGGREALASSLVVLAMLFVILGPLTGFMGLVAAQAVEVTQAVKPWVEEQLANPSSFEGIWDRLPFVDQFGWLESAIPSREELVAKVGDAVGKAGTFLVNTVASLTRNTAGFLINLFILLYAMFFFLMEGGHILDRILYFAPLEAEAEQRLVDRFVSVTRATLKGSLVIGFLQGGLAAFAFWLADIPGAAFWGTVMMVLSVIPGVGAPIVWVPACLWLAARGDFVAAGLVTAWCAVVVGSIDNVLRPRLVGADAKMSDLMILLGTLGGISLFGAVGFILGPIVAAIFVTVWDLYGEAFADILPPTRDRASP